MPKLFHILRIGRYTRPIVAAITTLTLLAAAPARAEDIEDCDEESLIQAMFLGEVTFTQDCSITLTATLEIDMDVTIDAQGHNVTISGDNLFQIFEVEPDATLTLLGVTIVGGLSTNGGAIYVHEDATVVLSNCTFAGNSAIGTNGASGLNGNNSSNNGGNGTSGTGGGPALGGAIYNLGDLTLQRCTFTTNSATAGSGGNGGNGGNGGSLGNGGDGGGGGIGSTAFGGAIYNLGTFSVSDCTFAGNLVTGGNGGLGGTNGSGFSPGRPGSGGRGGISAGAGIYSATDIFILNSTFSDNASKGGDGQAGGTQSNGNGGTGARGGDSFGAGAFVRGTDLETCNLTNCTFSGNSTIGGTGGTGGPGNFNGGNGGNGGNATGGGLYNTGKVAVMNCTFTLGAARGGTNGVSGPGSFPGNNGSKGASRGGNIANEGSTFFLKNTIIGTNLAGGGGYGTFTDGGKNISRDNSIALGPNSKKNTDPRIDVLADNGGPTRTIALLTNSPAVDGGSDSNCPATDQRGILRPVGPSCDVGAFEATFRPAIQTQPQSQTQTNGGRVTLFVVAFGNPTLTYRWRFNGTNIGGSVATHSNYTILSISVTNAGSYDVIVTNSFGAVTSSIAVVNVGFPPAISTPPTNVAVLSGGNATFTVSATGDLPLTYQWYFNATNPIPVATDSSYTVLNAQQINVGTYTVVITNLFGSITSAPATLTVNERPAITTQPASQEVDPGASVTFEVTATGTAPLRYQWYYNLSSPIAGATGPSWTFTAQSNNAGGYSVIVANDFGSIQSANATLTVPIPVFNISGRVVDGPNGVSGVTVAGAGTNSAITDINGNYAITNARSGDYFIFASLAGYQFSAPQEVIVGPDASNVNFTVTSRLYTLSGRVTANGVGLPGVIVFGGQITDDNGAFSFSLAEGSYTLTPQLTGYGFSPSKTTVTLPPDATNVNFVAGPVITSIVRRTNGVVVISLNGVGSARIQASTNLVNWVSVFTNIAPFQFIDNSATNFPLRFYRAIQP